MNVLSHPAPVRPRRADRRALILGMAASGAAHAVFAWVLSAGGVGLPPPPSRRIEPRLVFYPAPVVDPPPAVRIPPVATPILRPATPLAPVASPASAPDPLGPPEYIAHEVAPRLVNGPEILAALSAGYPDDVPEEAARSVVLLWLFVDPGGRVTGLRLQTSSGYPPLDRLATEVAPSMEYSPALHLGRRVGVWVAQRIRFRPPDGGALGGSGSG